MNNTVDDFDEAADFSLVLGGPLYQLYLRTHLARPPLALAGLFPYHGPGRRWLWSGPRGFLW